MTFKVNYKTEFGEALSIVGENAATGCWIDFSKGLMQWTEGDWWKVSLDIDPRKHFMYKYVVVDHASRTAKRWESGRNRICDPEHI